MKDEQCHIVGGRLTVSADKQDSRPPSLPAVCLIEAFAPASAGRAEAKSQRALINVGYPIFDVDVEPVPDITWSKNKQVIVHVNERSGATYTMWAGGSCGAGWAPLEGYSAPNTRTYDITVTLEDPGPTSKTCDMRAVAGPQDIAGGKDTDSFTITVNP